jgi:hypothetical protein
VVTPGGGLHRAVDNSVGISFASVKKIYGGNTMISESKNMRDHLKELEAITERFDPTGKETNGFYRTGNILFAQVLTGVVREWLERAEELMKSGNGGFPLSWETVREIRKTYQNGNGGQQAIARKYGVDPLMINQIVRGKIYKPSEDPFIRN